MAYQKMAFHYMNQKMPEIGIALAAYKPNPEHFKEQLLSIQNQKFQNWICVITFDSDIIVPEIKDERFFFIQNESRLGHVKNFEKAAQLCLKKNPHLKYIAFSDQDDIWYPNKLNSLYKHIKNLPPFSCVHSDMHITNSKNELISCWEYEGRKTNNLSLTDLNLRNVCTGAAALFDAELIKKYPIIPDCIRDHDHWYALLAIHFGKITAIKETLYTYRQHENNVIGAQKKAQLFQLRKKWNSKELLEHFKKIRVEYINRTFSLPIEPHTRNELISTRILIITLLKSILNKNWMLARNALANFIGKLFYK